MQIHCNKTLLEIQAANLYKAVIDILYKVYMQQIHCNTTLLEIQAANLYKAVIDIQQIHCNTMLLEIQAADIYQAVIDIQQIHCNTMLLEIQAADLYKAVIQTLYTLIKFSLKNSEPQGANHALHTAQLCVKKISDSDGSELARKAPLDSDLSVFILQKDCNIILWLCSLSFTVVFRIRVNLKNNIFF